MKKPILVPYWSTWNYSIRIVSDQRSGGFLRFNCTSPQQDCVLFQPDVGINHEKYQLTTVSHNKPLLARSSRDQRRSARRKGRQHGLPSKASNFRRSTVKPLLFCREECLSRILFARFSCVCLFSLVVFVLSCSKSRYERRG